MATGWAIGRREPAFVLLHTTAGLGNAVGALATARVNRAPLVVLVGQQDRRHVAFEPFLTGRLAGLAGEYPVWVDQPVAAARRTGLDRPRATRGGDAPRAGDRDRADGRLGRPGVPTTGRMRRRATSSGILGRRGGDRRAGRVPGRQRARRRSLSAQAPTIPRRGRRSPPSRSAWSPLSTRSRSEPEPGSSRITASTAACYPPTGRGCARSSRHDDVLLVVGAPVFRQSPYAEGPSDRARHADRRRR